MRIESHGPVFGSRDPDARGYYGSFGGRFVPETLVAPIEELTEAYFRVRDEEGFRTELGRPAAQLRRPPDAALRSEAADRLRRRRAHRAQARGSRAHRRAQDQQRARTGAAGGPHGEAADRRRDRRRAARRGDGDRVRAARARVPRLHGLRRHGAPVAQRLPDAAARRGSRRGHVRLAHAEGRDQRGDARLGDQRHRHLLPARLGARARIRIRSWCASSSR